MNESPITQVLLLNVRDISKRKGLQIKDIATRMGMAPESLSRSLHGNPTLSTLYSLAQALDVPVSRLLAQGGDRESEDILGVVMFGKKKTRVVKDLEDLEILIQQLKK